MAKKIKAKIKKSIKIKLAKKSKKILAKKKVKKRARPSLRAAAKQSGLPRRPSTSLRASRNDKQNSLPEFPAESLFKAKIKVIGIGGGGGSIVSEIGRSLEKATFVVADTDIRALKKKSGVKYFWFGEEQTHGLGTGVNVDLAKLAAEKAKEKISSFFKDQDIIIFIASLGGGLGSGATQVFAQACKEFGGITFGIFTMPFKFEGKNKYRIAQNALKPLRQMLNVSLVIPNEKIFKVIDANTAITDAFSLVNKSLIESLESLIDLIYNPGIINIDFADLKAILSGRGSTAFLNTVEEYGKDRAEKICERILINPLLQNSNFEAEKILFNIAGSENLSMFEVEKVSSHIASKNPKAKIIFGISKNPKLKNRIKTTVLITGGQAKEEAQVLQPAPEKIIGPIKKIVKNKKPKPKLKPKKKAGPVSIIPVFESPVLSSVNADESRIKINATIRRSGLEIKKAEEQEEKKRIAQEKEWEIPAFLRRVKYKN
ncbi:MAG: hypothetical protein A2528_01460 [Candidatus Staskawiczbacteria bacterium RIFOXYD2_FULL_37_9]|uniref:Cell division protein FtsZ n=1 Tax=Candidatus Staskawiczbacteria bacterium RIFOXYB1_FULL_37_44 TaxID=1802223 RepID=A0A1G2IYM5_9BACT|nr:MAG: hypothetical protein A2358_00515 [Candidatus Staskawiczbacteria bacterium RIFOXYB1_FULL_37_44]OGZ83494.1 MAG: hypothetical protein A2416_04180 [Candidatus Staskawiczbacteria bacterium RIFOXYC1_FULL_37_52]OGZ90168.1 MAG: hypothetical protein A2581_02020 [Candidatus Staskawiczbacteria bacterium RIFOXYD1_FULL_37_110]OGZ94225.1 MAG: hypothetical protein A2528_01460 [Candidatus Staskawiczbacteria bacterium RIFOXYD2_FULL_37_9]